MPQVGFKSTIPVFERAKTVHASERSPSVIGINNRYVLKTNEKQRFEQRNIFFVFLDPAVLKTMDFVESTKILTVACVQVTPALVLHSAVAVTAHASVQSSSG
jgi:hypothetical protein